MRQLLRVLRHLWQASLAAAFLYRADFLQDVFGSLLWSIFSFVSVLLVTSRLPVVAGFSRAELLLLASNYGIIVGLEHLFFTGAFRQLPSILQRGELDGYLLKPFDVLTLLTFRRIRLSSIFRVVGSILVSAWIIRIYGLSVTWSGIIGFIVLGLAAVLFIYSLFCLVMVPLIWYPRLDNLIELIHSSVGTTRYPQATARYMPRAAAIYFLPFLFIVNIPTLVLTGRMAFLEAGWYLAFCVGLYFLTRLSWRWALRHWVGAGN